MLACLLVIPTLYAKPDTDKIDNRVAKLEAQVIALIASLEAAKTQIAVNTSGVTANAGGIATNASGVATNVADISANGTAIAAIPSRYTDAEAVAAVDISGLEADIAYYDGLLDGLSRILVPDPETPAIEYDTLVFEGMNVQIVNGSESTGGTPDGVGNLIIGYNEGRTPYECPGSFDCDRRTGSHNLIVGYGNNYTSHGGMVVGFYNEISGNYTSVSGGDANTASGSYSSVSGGSLNNASGDSASVSGGKRNNASGDSASVSGGYENIASGNYASVSGGSDRTAGGEDDWRAGRLWEDK